MQDKKYFYSSKIDSFAKRESVMHYSTRSFPRIDT